MKKPKINPINNVKKRDGAIVYFIAFALILAFVVGHAFFANKPIPVAGNQPQIAENGMAAINPVPQIAMDKDGAPVKMNFTQIIAAADGKQIATMFIRDHTATGELTDGSKYTATIAYDPAMLERISASGAEITIDDSKGWIDMLGTWVPLVLGVLFIFWIWRGIRGAGAGGMPGISKYNPTKVTTGKTKTTFADIAGIDSEKREIMEIVEFLKEPEKFKNLGARVPRGILLAGEPGTGKTLLARAIAGEANVPFFATSGSDFSGIIVGLGVAKIKEIFEMAKRNSPCILFIDEIDAIGQHRGKSGFNDQDREQTLNQLLIEMDGFSTNSGIIVIGATNRPDMLDHALLRPGRFDRQVYIELPDLKGRREILDIYAKKVKLADSVKLDDVARGTTGFTGADLENLLNESALLAARDDHKKIQPSDIEEARDKIMMGPRKNKKVRAEDVKLTAYHEAGHAFISVHYRNITDPIHKATIIPRGRALGMVMHLPIDDKVSMTVSEIRANLAIAMAGRASEELFFGKDKITTGAEADIANATYLARYSITTAGLSNKIGTIAINQYHAGWGARRGLENASEKTAELVDAEVRAWIDAALSNATKILSQNKAIVKKLADELLARETLTREEIEEIVLGKKNKTKK